MARRPEEVLGIALGADEEAIHAARRELAKRLHPDAGGSVEAMQELNAAVAAALAERRERNSGGPPERPAPRRSPSRPPVPRRPGPGGVRRDHPSFTIEALPAVAFEGLVLAAALIGEVVDDDPPYLLQATLGAPQPCWAQLELVPDAGATSISLSIGRLPGHSRVDIDDVRDRWISALNQLDWSDPGSPQLPS